tara:strand:+ start:684 stop:944 length:261 start_codon:yes stop_codon:yes gene_type:complete
MKDDRGNLDLIKQIDDLKKKVREAEGETSLVKAVGMNSPEMRAMKSENEDLKAQLARAKEDHQYDNLVHQKEVESLVNKLRNKGLM